MTEVLAVVPARGGSKGVPRKNLRDIDGTPMVAYQIRTARSADEVDRTVLSTDDDEIAAVGREYGAEIPFVRPASLATDGVPVIAAVKHCAEFFGDAGDLPSYTVCLQPTSPFTTAKQINDAIQKVKSTGCDSVVSVTEVTETHPYRAYRLEDDRVRPINGITRGTPNQRQDRPAVYGFTGAIYVRKTQLLLKWDGEDFALGDDVRAIVQAAESSVEIDSEFDLRVARALASYE